MLKRCRKRIPLIPGPAARTSAREPDFEPDFTKKSSKMKIAIFLIFSYLLVTKTFFGHQVGATNPIGLKQFL